MTQRWFPLLSVLVMLMAAGLSSAGVLAPRKASDLVTVGSTDLAFNYPRCGGTGTMEFCAPGTGETGCTKLGDVIPPDQVLIVTSFSWVWGRPTTSSNLVIPVLNSCNTGPCRRLFTSSSALDSESGGRRYAGKSEVIPSGVVVRAGEFVCMIQSFYSDGDFEDGSLQGFLAPDR